MKHSTFYQTIPFFVTFLLLGLALATKVRFPTINPLSLTEEYEIFKSLGLKLKGNEQGWGRFIVGYLADEAPIVYESKRLRIAFGVHHPAKISLELLEGVKALTFSGDCLIPDGVGKNDMRCAVSQGRDLLFTSERLDQSKREVHFEVQLSGVEQITLRFYSEKNQLNSGHGVWADLKSNYRNGTHLNEK